VKRNVVSTLVKSEIRRKSISLAAELYVFEGFRRKIGIVHNAGCSIEEKMIRPYPAKDVVENTNKRSRSAP
jgi:hypothetical protein